MATLIDAPAIGYVNRAAGKAITATNATTGYPESNLATPLLSQPWRSTTLTSVNVDVDLGSSLDIDVMALVGFNGEDDATKSPVTSEASNYTSPEHNPGSSNAFDVTDPVLLSDTPTYGRDLIHFPGSTLNSRYVRFTLNDSGNPDAYLKASVYWAGPVWQQPGGMAVSSEPLEMFVGSPGVERAVRGWRITLEFLTDAESRALLSALRNKLRSGRYLLVPRPLSPATFLNEAIYCTLGEAPQRRVQPTSPITWDITMTFWECID